MRHVPSNNSAQADHPADHPTPPLHRVADHPWRAKQTARRIRTWREQHVPTDSAKKNATCWERRRAKTVTGDLPPEPAANAARQLPRRAERRPERSPHQAVNPARRRRAHRDSDTTRQNADGGRHAPKRTSSTRPPSGPAREGAAPTAGSPTHGQAPSGSPRTRAPSTRTLPVTRRAYRPRKGAKKITHAGNQMAEFGV